MPAVIGEGLKPLTTSQTPSENSHSAIGMARSLEIVGEHLSGCDGGYVGLGIDLGD